MYISLSDTWDVEPDQPFRGPPRGHNRGKNLWGCSCLLFFKKNVAELCLLAEGTSVPGLQSLEIHRHGQDVYAEVTLQWLQSALLFLLPGSPPLKLKTIVENRIPSTGRRNRAVSSPLHVPTAAFHLTTFSPSLKWWQIREGLRSLVASIMMFIPVIFHQ